MLEQASHLMICEASGRPVQVIARPGIRAERALIIQCLDRTDRCYAEECAFTTEGAYVLLVELWQFSAEALKPVCAGHEPACEHSG